MCHKLSFDLLFSNSPKSILVINHCNKGTPNGYNQSPVLQSSEEKTAELQYFSKIQTGLAIYLPESDQPLRSGAGDGISMADTGNHSKPSDLG